MTLFHRFLLVPSIKLAYYLGKFTGYLTTAFYIGREHSKWWMLNFQNAPKLFGDTDDLTRYPKL